VRAVFASARSPDDALRAVLVTIAPALLAPVLVPPQATALGMPPTVVGAAAALLVLVGAARFRDRWARAVATSGLVMAFTGWALTHPDLPEVGFVYLLGLVGLGAGIWPSRTGSVWQSFGPVPAASMVAVGLTLLGWTTVPDGPGGDLALAAAAVVPGAVALERSTGRIERQLATIAMLLPVSYSALRLGGILDTRAVFLVAAGPALLLSRTVPPTAVWRPAWRLFVEVVVTSPPRLLVASFASLSVVGALLLALPVSAASGRALPLVDALFMAVSATCVTGLTTIDPGRDLSTFGHGAVLLLIQVGGIAIMTFATAAALLAGRRVGVRQERVAAALLGGNVGAAGLRGTLRKVLVVTAIFEAAGALLLVPVFAAEGHGFFRSVVEAIYTSVSSFCNAGLLPWSDNLRPFERSPWMLVVVAAIVIAGSLGPAVLVSLPPYVQGKKVPLYVRLSVLTTIGLLVIPFLLILGLEWSNTLRDLPWHDRVANAWLLSAARTTGFDSVGVGQIDPGTWTLLLITMFIGGTTGSTAGGIRVTTFAVLLLAGIATIRGRRSPEFGYRQIPHRAVYEAIAITCAGITAVAAALLLLLITQKLAVDVALFEVVSALGTVGLSMGATSQLDTVGKLVVIVCMFAGRVGPLTLILFLAERERDPTPTAWPIEEVPVG
jgi:trk system potassium uptake protein